MLIDIRKVILFLLVSVLSLSVTAQTLSEVEVTEKMEKAADLQKSGEYAEARAILYEILPSATGKKKDEILFGIPVMWYLEAHRNYMILQFEEALVSYQKAREGFHQIGHKEYELLALKGAAGAEEYLKKMDDTVRSYTQCIPLAQELGDEATEMEALTKLYKIFYNVGEYEIAHSYGATIEGELGHVGTTKEEIGTEHTKVDEAIRYVEETGVSALAIMVGTAHGHYKQAPVLNIQRIKEIHDATSAHLVLHGGSGVPDDQIRASIDAGIRKINFSTDLCCAFMNTVRNVDPSIIGLDMVMKDPINAVKDFAMSKIKLLGADKA